MNAGNYGLAVLLSIQKKWVDLIRSGEKTVDVRKIIPKKVKLPFKCYIYETKHGGGEGKVIGYFICDMIAAVVSHPRIFAGHDLLHKEAIRRACLTDDDVIKYANGKDVVGLCISDFHSFSKPKELSELYMPCITPKMPYCPACKCGYEYISEGEAEFYRVDGECSTEWICLNHVKRPPQSWCYVSELRE